MSYLSLQKSIVSYFSLLKLYINLERRIKEDELNEVKYNLIKGQISKKRKISNFELTLFLFTMVFMVKFNNLDLRIFVSVFWVFKALGINKEQILIKRIYEKYFLFLLGIISYSTFVLLINGSTYFFMILRYLRASLTLFTIVVYFYVYDIQPKPLIDASLKILLLHAFIVIAQIINPDIEQYVSIVSGYTKKAIDFRASGLVSGYDFAGTYLNVGVFISMCSFIISKHKKYLWYSLILTVTVFMTSRMSTVILIVTYVWLVFIAKKFKKRVLATYLTIVLSVVGILTLFFLVLSMEIAPSLRESLISNIPLARKIYVDMPYNYGIVNVLDSIMHQVNMPTDISFILGIAESAPTDPGFLSTIYSIGYIGLCAVLGFYLHLFFRSKKRLKNLLSRKASPDFKIVCFYSTVFIIVIMIIMDIKLCFLFATGIHEILMIFIVVCERVYAEDFGYKKRKPATLFMAEKTLGLDKV